MFIKFNGGYMIACFHTFLELLWGNLREFPGPNSHLRGDYRYVWAFVAFDVCALGLEHGYTQTPW